MKWTKEQLLADNGLLAYKLARSANKEFAYSEFAQDYDIVSIGDGDCLPDEELVCRGYTHSGATNFITYNCVASWLAYNSDLTYWGTYSYRILELGNDEVAYWLARHSGVTGWITYNLEILKLYDDCVAVNLAYNSPLNGWFTDNPDILELGYGAVEQNLLRTIDDPNQLKLVI